MHLLASHLTAALLLVKIVLVYFKKALLLFRFLWSGHQLFNCHSYFFWSLFRRNICLQSDRLPNISIALGFHVLSTNLIDAVFRAINFSDFWLANATVIDIANATVFNIAIFFKCSFEAARTELRARYKIFVALEEWWEILYSFTFPALMIGL